jgi:putative RecB family exonuclease
MATSTTSGKAAVTHDDDKRADLPGRLSPSRALDFTQCPAKFYFRSVLRLPSEPTLAQVRGNVAHDAFERVFDHPRGERTPEVAVSYVAPAWETIRSKGGYDHLDGDTVVADSQALVRAWFGVEDPNRFDPDGRELRLSAELSGVPVVGILDRIDRVQRSDGSSAWVVSDYKTGKVPAPNDRFLDEKFFGMEVYAALWHHTTGEVPAALRLVYVAGGSPDSVRTRPCDLATIERTVRKLRGVWDAVSRSARTGSWACKTGPLCNWCDYQQICPAFNPALDGADVA